VQIQAKQVRARVKELPEIIEQYKELHPGKNRNYIRYEALFKKRIRLAIRNLEDLIEEAVKDLEIVGKNNNKHSLSLSRRIKLILVKELSQKGNRKTANLLDLFSLLSGTEVSYKTVERLYSDGKVMLGLHNLFVLALKKRGISRIDYCGDATGYSLTITKHYRSYASQLKEKSKDQTFVKRKLFCYKFAIMDLETQMYVCYGSSLKSERAAFDKAMQMLQNLDVKIDSIRLDRYYSFPCYVNLFKASIIFIIPRKNCALANGFKWHETLKEFLLDTMNYLEEYFKRNNSESQFSSDKKMFGWRVSQKLEERIDTALFARVVWHNLLLIYS